MKKLIPLLALILTACQEAPSAYVAEPFSFEQAGVMPATIRVAKIDLIDHYPSPLKRPNVEQDFLVTPDKAVEKWLDRRLRAGGSSGTLEVTISDASVIETALPKTEGIKGLFTDDQDARYDARIVVTFRLFEDGARVSKATGDVEIKRFITIHEKATVFERQRLYHRMLQAMMTDFDREANARLQQYFSAYLGK